MEHWRRSNPGGWKRNSPSAAQVAKPEGHTAAAVGDVEALKELAVDNKRALHTADKNGWQPIHEAIRGGHYDAVKMLIENGADMNAITNQGDGVSPYHIALRSLSKEHPVAQYLESLGAIDVGPDL